MPITSRKLIAHLKVTGFKPVSKTGSHRKLKDSKGNIIIVPEHKGMAVNRGIVWNINRRLKLLKYPQLNLK